MKCGPSCASTARDSGTPEAFQELLSPLKVVLSGGRRLAPGQGQRAEGPNSALTSSSFLLHSPQLLPRKYTFLLNCFISNHLIKIIHAHKKKTIEKERQGNNHLPYNLFTSLGPSPEPSTVHDVPFQSHRKSPLSCRAHTTQSLCFYFLFSDSAVPADSLP